MDRSYLVLDCESIGLWGEVFAFAAILIDEQGRVMEEHVEACNPDNARGTFMDREWVRTNVPFLIRTATDPTDIRNGFWRLWRSFGGGGYPQLVVDCGFPVETNFIARCVEDSTYQRGWDGPFPIHEIATLRHTAVILKDVSLVRSFGERLSDELPEHDPLRDARHSARVWTALNTILRN